MTVIFLNSILYCWAVSHVTVQYVAMRRIPQRYELPSVLPYPPGRQLGMPGGWWLVYWEWWGATGIVVWLCDLDCYIGNGGSAGHAGYSHAARQCQLHICYGAGSPWWAVRGRLPLRQCSKSAMSLSRGGSPSH